MRFGKEFVLCALFFVAACLLQFPALIPTMSQPEPSQNTDGMIKIGGQSIYHKLYKPTTNAANVTAVLLHGASFTSQNWEDIGTLSHLADQGILAFAIDLPGYGKSRKARVTDKAEFLKSAVDYIEGDRKVIVSPSMSGSFSIPYINKYGKEIDGYVPVAPVSVYSLDPTNSVQNNLHVFAVVGEKDAGGVMGLKTFQQTFANYKELIIKNGSHPAYLYDPELFNSELSSFARSLN